MKERRDPNSGKQTHLDPYHTERRKHTSLANREQRNTELSLESGNAASFLLYALGFTHLNMFS